MSGRFVDPFPQYLDSTPNVRSGARLFFYQNGTSTKLDTYPTIADRQAGTNANSNPITLNSSGYPNVGIFLQNRAYTVVLAPPGSDDPPSSPVWTAPDVYGTDLTTVAQTKVGSGSPSGNVSGTAGSSGVVPDFYFDFTGSVLYVCTTTGDAASAVWTAINASAATPSVPQPQGYLTLVSGTPVMTSDQASKTVVYYTPDKGNLIPIYNGSSFSPTEFSELTLTLVSSHALSTLYDIFVWSEAGVITLGTGPAWTTSTAGSGARGSGASTTELTRVNGLLVNAVAMTTRNGNSTYSVNANRATYVGSIFIDGTAGQVTCHRSFGQSRKWGLWNAYNRRRLILKAGDSTPSWAYATATTRPSNNSTANSLTLFDGLAEEIADLKFIQNVTNASEDLAATRIGIGYNATNSFAGLAGTVGIEQGSGTTDSQQFADIGYYIAPPALGINVVTSLERGDGAATATFLGGEEDMQLIASWMG